MEPIAESVIKYTREGAVSWRRLKHGEDGQGCSCCREYSGRRRVGHPSVNPDCLVKHLFDIAGIDRINVAGAYTVQITVGAAFSWDEIHPQVVDLLEHGAATSGGAVVQ